MQSKVPVAAESSAPASSASSTGAATVVPPAVVVESASSPPQPVLSDGVVPSTQPTPFSDTTAELENDNSTAMHDASDADVDHSVTAEQEGGKQEQEEEEAKEEPATAVANKQPPVFAPKKELDMFGDDDGLDIFGDEEINTQVRLPPPPLSPYQPPFSLLPHHKLRTTRLCLLLNIDCQLMRPYEFFAC